MNKSKIQTAIDRIREFEPEEGYYGGNSGGKDSGVLWDLTTRAGVKVDWHFNKTTVDPPEVIPFVREAYPETSIDQPDITMWRLIAEHGFPPTRLIRYCCERLKENGGKNRRVLTGIRWEESRRRAGRLMVESCYRHNLKTFVHPIIDWTTEEVWDYTRERGLPVCSLYKTQKRIGCVACPMAGAKNRQAELARYPNFRRAYVRAFDNMLLTREYKGRKTTWKTGEEVMAWWLSC